MNNSRRLETHLIHAGEPETPIEGAVNLPIFQSATFAYGGQQSYHELGYIRLNNTPNHRVLHDKLARIAGAEAGLVTASGMAAITTTLMAWLEPGDHFLAQRCLYGGTGTFVGHDARRLGWQSDAIDAAAPATWEALLRPATRLIYVETLANPLLDVADLEAVAAFAKRHGIVSIVDNTFASPVNCRPHDLGFDIVLESATKYLNGHSDIVAGAITGSAAHIERIGHLLNHLGGCLDPHACFLLRRGLQTLALRVRQQNDNALRLARFLQSAPGVLRVRYPFLESHPQYALARRLLQGGGGVLSFELEGGAAVADVLLSRLELASVAPSLGGTETLATRPATTSHRGLSASEREAMGIAEGLVRVAVGIEAAEDLCADFEQALVPR